MRALPASIAAILVLGCVSPDDPLLDEDAEGDKGDSIRGIGIDPMSRAACAILQVANGPDRDGLVALGVHARAAGSIARHRAAEDLILGTSDDRAITTLEELDSLRDVGPMAMRSLRDAAEQQGIVCGGGMVRVQAVREGIAAAELWAAFRDGDGAWRPLPATAGPLVFPVADERGRYSVALFCRNEATDWGRPTGALSTFELTTAEASDLVLDRDLKLWGCGSRWLAPEIPVRIDLDSVQSPEIVVASLGRDTHFFPSPPRLTLEPTAGIADLFIQRRPDREVYPPTAAYVRRGVEVSAGLRLTVARGDFVPLEHRLAPVVGEAAPYTWGSVTLRSATGSEMSLSGREPVSTGSRVAYALLPDELRRPDDVYVIRSSTHPIEADFFLVRHTRYVAHAEDVAFEAPPMRKPSGRFARRSDGRVAVTIDPYPGAALYAFDLLGSRGMGWILLRSAARQAERPEAELPVLAGVRGFDPAWQLPSSVSGGPSVLLLEGGDTAQLFQPARRVGMTITIVQR